MNKIKEFRNKKRISQINLAKIMNVNQSTIANWESEYRNPNIRQAIRLAELLDTSVESLYK